LKKTLFAFLLSITSACAQSYETPDSGIQIIPAESANIIRDQLLLQFDDDVSVMKARSRASQCGSVIRVVTVKPALILVQLSTSGNTDSNVQVCQNLNGLVRAEWNQKRRLR